MFFGTSSYGEYRIGAIVEVVGGGSRDSGTPLVGTSRDSESPLAGTSPRDSPSPRAAARPFAKLAGSITSFGWAFLHST